MYKLSFYVPEDSLEKVKEALFAAGAGKIGLYEKCCWQTLGTGQYIPLEGSNPSIGSIGDIEKVQEYKVEMVCDDKYVKELLVSLYKSHPYEEPAYDLVKVYTRNDFN